MRRSPYYPDIQPNLAGMPWDYDKIYADHRLKAGDILYLMAAYGELYGWGYVTKSVAYRDSEDEKEALRVTAVRPIVRQNLVPAEAIKRVPTLARLIVNSDLNLIELQPHQVNSFNRLIRSQGVEAPADIEDYKNPDMHLSRLHKIYEAANGSRTKLIELMEVLKEDVSNEQEAWDEADYMKDEGWVETLSDDGPPLVRLTHKGLKAAEEYAFSSTETKAQQEIQEKAVTLMPANLSEELPIDIFISHSSQDAKIVKALIAVLQKALNLTAQQIRCTSIEGYKLDIGADTNEQLRREIYGAIVFIGLITPISLTSTYVLFELGARWGAGRTLLPVVAAADTDILKDPLKGKNAGCLFKEADVHELIRVLAQQLNRSTDRVAAYENLIKRLIRTSKPKREAKAKADKGTTEQERLDGDTDETSTLPLNEDPFDDAARLSARLNYDQRRNSWRRSERGVESARIELDKLFTELERLVQGMSTKDYPFDITFKRDDREHCTLLIGEYGLSVNWSYGTIRMADSIEETSLVLMTFKKGNMLDRQVKIIRRIEYDLDMNESFQVGWRERAYKRRFLHTPDFAKEVIKELLRFFDERTHRK